MRPTTAAWSSSPSESQGPTYQETHRLTKPLTSAPCVDQQQTRMIYSSEEYAAAVQLPLNQPLSLSFQTVYHQSFAEQVPRYEPIGATSADAKSSDKMVSDCNGITSEARSDDVELMSLLNSYFPPGFDVAVANTVHEYSEETLSGSASVVEIVYDAGRTPFVRFSNGVCRNVVVNASTDVAFEDLIHHIERFMQVSEAGRDPKTLVDMLPHDNRMGIAGTLHRVSFIRNRMQDRIIGLTLRFGRYIKGSTTLLQDVMAYVGKTATIGGSRPGLLLLGPPGVGKTTLLREITYELSTTYQKNVVVVDTSNEIAGDGDVPHECIGRARRLQVSNATRQHEVMLEAVKNHCPDVVVIDELSTAAEVIAAKSIAQRGVSLVATAHGCNLGDLIRNPVLVGLLGGIQSVILSANEAKERRSDRKTRLERTGAPVFSTLIEIWGKSHYCIHANVAHTVDELLNPLSQGTGIKRKARSEARFYEVAVDGKSKHMRAVLQPKGRGDPRDQSQLDTIYGNL